MAMGFHIQPLFILMGLQAVGEQMWAYQQ